MWSSRWVCRLDDVASLLCHRRSVVHLFCCRSLFSHALHLPLLRVSLIEPLLFLPVRRVVSLDREQEGTRDRKSRFTH